MHRITLLTEPQLRLMLLNVAEAQDGEALVLETPGSPDCHRIGQESPLHWYHQIGFPWRT